MRMMATWLVQDGCKQRQIEVGSIWMKNALCVHAQYYMANLCIVWCILVYMCIQYVYGIWVAQGPRVTREAAWTCRPIMRQATAYLHARPTIAQAQRGRRQSCAEGILNQITVLDRL
jgi:hypothetical protein